jgi:hypothetical protein
MRRLHRVVVESSFPGDIFRGKRHVVVEVEIRRGGRKPLRR